MDFFPIIRIRIVVVLIYVFCFSCNDTTNFKKESKSNSIDGDTNRHVDKNDTGNKNDSVSSINFTTEKGIINIDVCHLNKIKLLFPKQKQKVYSTDSEGSDWFEWNIKIDNKQWISLESSDSTFKYISRFSTNSASVITNTGYSVGMKISRIKSPVVLMEDFNDKSFQLANSNLGFRIDLNENNSSFTFKKIAMDNPGLIIKELILLPNCN